MDMVAARKPELLKEPADGPGELELDPDDKTRDFALEACVKNGLDIPANSTMGARFHRFMKKNWTEQQQEAYKNSNEAKKLLWQCH